MRSVARQRACDYSTRTKCLLDATNVDDHAAHGETIRPGRCCHDISNETISNAIPLAAHDETKWPGRCCQDGIFASCDLGYGSR